MTVNVEVPGDPMSLEVLRRMVEAEGGSLEYEAPTERRGSAQDWAYAASTNIPAVILTLSPAAVATIMRKHREAMDDLRNKGRHSRPT